MKTKYLLILVVLMIVCFGIFFYQMDHNLDTIIVFNSTEIPENGTAVGYLMDSFGRGIPNKTITFHKPGYEMGTLVTVTTDDNGTFYIRNLQYLPGAGKDNYYGNFTFAGDDKYKASTFNQKLTVIPKS